MKRQSVHWLAALAVRDVIDFNRSLDDALATRRQGLAEKSAPLLAEIAYGGCRFFCYYDSIVGELLKKPLKEKDRPVHFLVVNALYQIEHMRTPDHAVVNETVKALRKTKQAWASKLVNAVLRRFLRERESLAAAADDIARRHGFPAWLHDRIREDWPAEAERVFAASNARPPLTLRVNRARTDRDTYLAMLAERGIDAVATEDSSLGVTLARPVDVSRIPGFTDGQVSVQDESAQLVLPALDLAGGQRVLDACAAPGGKTCLLLEAGPQPVELVAVDLPDRVPAIAENLERLGLEAEIVAADMIHEPLDWASAPFDRILLDAPCTGSGVIRRHPDIRHRRRPTDLEKFAGQQLALLTGSWSLLADGGKLLYVTCSILPQENDEVIEQFLSRHPDAVAESPESIPGQSTRYGRQRLPGVHSGDGFYYCCLGKPAIA